MVHPQIILSGCFSNLSLGEISIPDEFLHDLSQLKIDGEDDMSFSEHASLFIKFCDYYEFDCEYVACTIFCLTLEGNVSRWCHTLRPTSIHSLNHIIEELHLAFNIYDY